jgi:hypothetical protein
MYLVSPIPKREITDFWKTPLLPLLHALVVVQTRLICLRKLPLPLYALGCPDPPDLSPKSLSCNEGHEDHNIHSR